VLIDKTLLVQPLFMLFIPFGWVEMVSDLIILPLLYTLQRQRSLPLLLLALHGWMVTSLPRWWKNKSKLRNAPQVTLVLWKTPSFGWIKANTDGSVLGNLAACGGLFLNHSSNHMGSYAQPLGTVSILHAELMAIILAIEFDVAHSW
jgi:hypothetical protein